MSALDAVPLTSVPPGAAPLAVAPLADETVVGLQPWCRLRFDKVRDKWVLLAPERVLFPCPTSVEILNRLSPGRRLGEVVDELAAEFDAPADVIGCDVRSMLQDLADQGFLAVCPGSEALRRRA